MRRAAAICPGCDHDVLGTLSIVHVDWDAFYATVEKRERPELADRPVIIGGGARGVLLACCYVSQLYGVRSAMPMFKAPAACPDAVVIRRGSGVFRRQAGIVCYGGSAPRCSAGSLRMALPR
jgi:impB/mucB/samB family